MGLVVMASEGSAADCGVDGCPKPAVKGGLCVGHYQRKMRGQTVNTPLREYTKEPAKALTVASIRLADAEDAPSRDAGPNAFERARENARASLRRYLWHYVPRLLRRQKFTQATKAEIERFLADYKKRQGR